MEAIIVNRKLSDKEVQEIQLLLNKHDKTELFSNVVLPETLQNKCLGGFELAADEKREINFELMKKIVDYGETSINDETITDLLTYEKASIWHYHKFRIYFTIRNLFYESELIKKLQKKYSVLYFFGESNLLNDLCSSMDGVHIKTLKTEKAKVSNITVLRFFIFFIIRSFVGFLQLPRLTNKKHIVVDHAIKQTCLNLQSLKPEPGNYNLQYLFDKLEADFIILDDREIPKFHKGSEFSFKSSDFKASKKTFFGECVLFQGMLSGKIRKELKEAYGNLKSHYQQIENKSTDPFSRLVIRQLISLHSSSKLFLTKYLAYKLFFKRHNFISVTSIDENSARIKSILDAAKTQGVKTVGIQHGTIHELHPAYIFSEQDQGRNIMADLTMVWGEFWSDFLINKGKYHPESLKVSGQIRTDIIPKLKTLKPQDYLNLPRNSKIIVFASQPQRDPKLRYRAAFDVFTAVKDLDNTQLIVKLHPAEKNDFEYYHDIAKKAGCSNYQILLQFDLYLLISLSEIVITCFSTVGAETVYFNKPLIILDHLKQDIQGYLREEIALQATDNIELKRFLEKLLRGEIKHNTNAYKNYIEKYAYKIDGKVAERIISIIRNL